MAEDVMVPDSKEILLPKGHLVTLEDSDKINKMGVESIKARSTITCDARYGVCDITTLNDCFHHQTIFCTTIFFIHHQVLCNINQTTRQVT
jgi:hypothetical protein